MAGSKSTGTDTVVKVILVFFISLLSFSIGTFVGKKFSDNQHKMIALEPKKAKVEDTSNEEASETTAHDQSAKAHEESSATEEEVSHNTNKSEETVEPNAHSNVADDQASNLDSELQGEEEFASNSPKAEPAKEPAKGHDVKGHQAKEVQAETPKLSKVLAKQLSNQESGKFTIQVAAYPTQEEAEKRVSELKAMKFDSFSTEATIKGHQWFRVNVGMFATIKEAQEHKTLLAEKAKISTALIQKLNR